MTPKEPFRFSKSEIRNPKFFLLPSIMMARSEFGGVVAGQFGGVYVHLAFLDQGQEVLVKGSACRTSRLP